MATHSSLLTWRIPWTEEPGRLQSMGSESGTTEGLRLVLFLFFPLPECSSPPLMGGFYCILQILGRCVFAI